MIEKNHYEQTCSFLGRKRNSALMRARGDQSVGPVSIAEIHAGSVVGEPD
jgi:hypothetical protein